MPIRTQDKQICFIIGIGSSGTTILNKLLNDHPELHCLPEANFLLFFLHGYKNVKQFSPVQIGHIFEQIGIFSRSHPWIGWHFEPEKTKEKILAQLDEKKELSYADLCRIIYSDFRVSGFDKSEARILIDKNPGYTIYTDKLSGFLPSAKFIWLVRDYRGNVLSRKEKVFMR